MMPGAPEGQDKTMVQAQVLSGGLRQINGGSLPPLEHEVIERSIAAKHAIEIAAELGISVGMVRKHACSTALRSNCSAGTPRAPL